jgi:hypothetical protein
MIAVKITTHEIGRQIQAETKGLEQFQREFGTGIQVVHHRAPEFVSTLWPSIALTVDWIDALAGKIENLFFIALILGQLVIIKAPGIFPTTQDLKFFVERQSKQTMGLLPDRLYLFATNAMVDHLEKTPGLAGLRDLIDRIASVIAGNIAEQLRDINHGYLIQHRTLFGDWMQIKILRFCVHG